MFNKSQFFLIFLLFFLAYQPSLSMATPIPVYAKFQVSGGWTTSISICNNGAYPLPLSNLELDFNYSAPITSVWGSPYFNWNIAENQHNVALTTSSNYPALQPDPECKKPVTVQFSSDIQSSLPSQLVLKSEGGHPIEHGQLDIKMTPTPPLPNSDSPTVILNGMDINQASHSLPWGEKWHLDNLMTGAYTITANLLDDERHYYQAITTPNPVMINKDKLATAQITYQALPTGNAVIHLNNSPDVIEPVLFKSAEYSTERLVSSDQEITLPAGTYRLSSRIKQKKAVFSVNPLVINPQQKTPLTITYQSVPTVLGWPTDRIAMGTIINGGSEENQLYKRPVDAVFTYTGFNGAGDRGEIISPDDKVTRLMSETRRLETAIKKPIIPVFVFYSVDGSDGESSILEDLGYNPTTQKPDPVYFEDLVKHYVNLISLANQLENYKDASHLFPATLLLNPDFLGELHKQCQPNNCQIPYQHFSVQVGAALKAAIDIVNSYNLIGYTIDPKIIPERYYSKDTTIPDYISSINWIVYTFGPDIPVGWQDNVWAGDSSGHAWLHAARDDKDNKLLNSHIANETTFLKQMNLFDDTYAPDYLAFDKYERDVFQKGDSYVSGGYLYNVGDYEVYLSLIKGISENFNNIPIMLWQIPGGHLQINGDIDSRHDHGASDADFYVGNPNLKTDLSNLLLYIQQTPFPNANNNYHTSASTVSQYLLSCPANESSDCWKEDHMALVKNSHVFAMLWGGGSTTGIAGLSPTLDDHGWLYQRLAGMTG